MIRRPPRSTLDRSSAASDVYKRQIKNNEGNLGQIVAELHVVSQNLKVITTYTKALTATLGEKPSRLIWGGGKNQLPSEKEILESSKPVPVPIEPPQRKSAP